VESDARKDNLRELVGSILDYQVEAANEGEEGTLNGYLERVTLSSDVDALEDAPRVAMMTVHAAKGLEFNTVFLTGMEEDLFPFRGMDPKRAEDMEEERRLAYVAVTRARERLFITYADRRAIFGQTRFGLPSRFITDLPKASMRQGMTSSREAHRIDRPDAALGGLIARARAGWSHPQERAASAMGSAFPRPQRAAEPQRAPGERYIERDEGEVRARAGGKVEHKVYGLGVVQHIDEGDDPIVTVKFSGYGQKRIKAAFLRFLG